MIELPPQDPEPSDFAYRQALGALEQLARSCLQQVASETGSGLPKAGYEDARFRTLVENIPAVTFIAHLEGGVPELYVSPQIEKLLGFSAEEWLSDPILWYRQLHPDDRDRWNQQFSPTCGTGEPFRAVYRFLDRAGRVVWIHGSANLVHDPHGQGRFLQGVAFDITAIKEAELALEQARADLELRVSERTADLALANLALQAEIAQRKAIQEEREQLLEREQRARAAAESANRAKDEFLAVLSHELRTPLNSMLGWIHLLRGGKLDAPTTARGLDVLERGTRVQVRLINELLDVSRIITGKLRLDTRAIELADIVTTAIDVIRPTARAKGISLVISLDSTPTPVAGDATRLQQMVWNLLANAVKFTPGRVGESPTAPGRVEVSLRAVDGCAELCVQDTGQGIRPGLLPFVFDRFRQGDSTTTREHGGLGLGLAIVRHLVELHGGAVAAESAGEGKGACFRITLPLLSELAEGAGDPGSGKETLTG